MPTPRPVPATAQFFLRGLLGGLIPWENQCFVGTTGPGTWDPADLTDMAHFVLAAWNTEFMPTASVHAELDSIHAVDLSSMSGPVSDVSQAPVFGGASGDPLPFSSSTVVSWLESLRYRGGKPRTYLPPTAKTQSTDGLTYISSYVTAIAAGAVSLRNSINAHVLPSGRFTTMAAVHRTSHGVQLPVPLVVAISGSSVSSRIRSQRGRLS